MNKPKPTITIDPDAPIKAPKTFRELIDLTLAAAALERPADAGGHHVTGLNRAQRRAARKNVQRRLKRATRNRP